MQGKRHVCSCEMYSKISLTSEGSRLEKRITVLLRTVGLQFCCIFSSFTACFGITFSPRTIFVLLFRKPGGGESSLKDPVDRLTKFREMVGCGNSVCCIYEGDNVGLKE